MRLYRTRSGNWVGTQADATRVAREDGSNGHWRQVEVPTDKPGLIAWLGSQQIAEETIDRASLLDPIPATVAPANLADVPTEAAARISVEEEIQRCDLPRLAVLAQNIAWRFHELGKGDAR